MSTFKMQLDPKKDQFINKCRPICAEYYYRCLDSIVGDLLDYLNESWTHFHATGILILPHTMIYRLGV